MLQQPIPPPETAWHWPALLIWVCGEVLAVTFVLRVLLRGGAPASTMLWIVVILAAPWIGLLLYYLFPRRLQRRRLRKHRDRLSWIEGGLDRLLPVDEIPSDSPTLERILYRLEGDRLLPGNMVRWLPTGRDYLDALLEAVAGAERFVHFETYILRSDRSGRRVLAALTEAARRGVAVRLLFDSFGSFGLGNSELAPLRAAGGLAAAFQPLFWKKRPFTLNLRNHRKLLIVDGERALLGGRNVGDEYVDDVLPGGGAWWDAMVEVSGPAVARLHRAFAEDWHSATDEDLVDERWFPRPAASGDCAVGVLQSGPDREVSSLWFATLHLINAASRSIDFSSPYLVPPPALSLALRLAAARGVRVRVHTNGPLREAFVLYHAQRSYYRELVEGGIELFESVDDYNHTKVLVTDGECTMVGSANLDMRSVHLNFELGVLVPSTHLAAAVMKTLDERRQLGRRIQSEDLPRGSLRALLDAACRLLSPVL